MPRARPMAMRARRDLESTGTWRWNLEMESGDGISSQRCGAGRDPSLQLPCNLQPLAATATGRRSIVGRSGRLARGRPGRLAPRYAQAGVRPSPACTAASFLACRGGGSRAVPVAFTSRFHSERLCRGRGGEVHSRLCAAVAADRDRGREGRRAAGSRLGPVCVM